jgi:hypothetical protein
LQRLSRMRPVLAGTLNFTIDIVQLTTAKIVNLEVKNLNSGVDTTYSVANGTWNNGEPQGTSGDSFKITIIVRNDGGTGQITMTIKVNGSIVGSATNTVTGPGGLTGCSSGTFVLTSDGAVEITASP